MQDISVYYLILSILRIIKLCMQGRNVDGLIFYFGEDPTKCPFEQGMHIQDYIYVVFYVKRGVSELFECS